MDRRFYALVDYRFTGIVFRLLLYTDIEYFNQFDFYWNFEFNPEI